MKRLIYALITVVTVSLVISSCNRGISPYEAANGKAKCGKYYIK